MREFVVYALTRRGKPFYVGSTCRPKARLREHRTKRGPGFSMRVIEHIKTFKRSRQRERYWIKALNVEGSAKGGIPKENPDIWVCVWLSTEELDEVRARAKKDNRTVSAWIRRAILEKLARVARH